jgi:8-amino-7-oxononanoate synthase
MTALDGYRAELSRALAAREAQGLRRHLRLPAGIDLVSNDYLGLREDARLRERMRDALDSLGAGSGGSRLLRGHQAAFDRIEERLAAFSGAETALLFGSGYAANVGLLQAVAGPEDLVVSDALNHASLIDGTRLSGARKAIYPHRDVGAVAEILARPRPGRAFVVTESLFSMDGDFAPLPELATVAEAAGALLVVDEAHATGLYGARGSGRVEELGLRDRVLATMHTGGKALGSGGAWVAGPSELRDTLLNRARTFIFSTAPLPVLTAALEAALDVLAQEPALRAELFRKAHLLRSRLRDAGMLAAESSSPIVPVVVGDNAASVALQEGLFEAGFDARAVRPPTVPEGTARLRVTVRVPVPDAELDRFASEVGSRVRGLVTAP